jgi:hypothetical protein
MGRMLQEYFTTKKALTPSYKELLPRKNLLFPKYFPVGTVHGPTRAELTTKVKAFHYYDTKT